MKNLDVERLATATARVVGLDTANEYHLEWAAKVAAEYDRISSEAESRPKSDAAGSSPASGHQP